jgi:flagellar biosynthetic protein FlhB
VAEQQEQNRSEPATPFKLQEARKKGQIARSMDFGSFVMVWAFLLAALVAGAGIWHGLAETSAGIIAGAASPAADLAGYLAGIRSFVFWTLSLVVPVASVAMIVGVVGNLVQTGPVLSFQPLKPQFERINPVAGFKRIFNTRMMFEAFKSVLKLVLFVAIMVFFFVGL